MKKIGLSVSLLAVAAMCGQQRLPEEKILRLPEQTLAVDDFHATGYILDIGGGGEGIIGRIKPSQTVAIDLFRRELEEAPPGPLKIVMDAKDLKFLDGAFPSATAFFSLMFMPVTDHAAVFKEVHRVLAPGGQFRIWDLKLPLRTDPSKEAVICRFVFKLPKEEVRTGYGTRFPPHAVNLEWYRDLAKQTGFAVESASEQGEMVKLTLRKLSPSAPPPTPERRQPGS